MQEANRWVKWSFLQFLIFKGHSLVLTIDGKAERALVHVEEDSKDAESFEALTIFFTSRVRIVPQLAYTEESPSCFQVGKRNLKVVIVYACNILLVFNLLQVSTWFLNIVDARYTNFDFVFSSGISNNLPVMNTLIELNITEEVSEDILVFLDKKLSLIRTNLDSL